MVYLKEHPEIKHGKIRVGFNPDEEIGLGDINLMWRDSDASGHIRWMVVK